MIALLGASALILAALQASIAAPTWAFRAVFMTRPRKATNQKVARTRSDLSARCLHGPDGVLEEALDCTSPIKNGMTKKGCRWTMPRTTIEDYASILAVYVTNSSPSKTRLPSRSLPLLRCVIARLPSRTSSAAAKNLGLHGGYFAEDVIE